MELPSLKLILKHVLVNHFKVQTLAPTKRQNQSMKVEEFFLELLFPKIRHPGKLTAGSPTAITHEKKGKWSEPNLQGIMCKMLIFIIFRGVVFSEKNTSNLMVFRLLGFVSLATLNNFHLNVVRKPTNIPPVAVDFFGALKQQKLMGIHR